MFDRNGEYTPYDILPSPFGGANGYETPDVATLVLNYKYKKFAFTPSATYSSGSFYGSPLIYPGYDPTTCAASPALNSTNSQTCGNYLFIPDKYTGKFDSFGALREPTRLTLNTQFSYDVSRNLKITLTMTGLEDLCFQRKYAWDNGSTCVYSNLASNLLGAGRQLRARGQNADSAAVSVRQLVQTTRRRASSVRSFRSTRS